MSNLTDVLKNAMNLDVHDRATLAERLLASLEELSEEEAESEASDVDVEFELFNQTEADFLAVRSLLGGPGQEALGPFADDHFAIVDGDG